MMHYIGLILGGEIWESGREGAFTLGNATTLYRRAWYAKASLAELS